MRCWLRWLWILGVLCVLSLYYRHLHADFPNYSPWTDWAKFTDEGWYGDAAIRQSLFGRWDMPGDFNPGAALPVLPLLELPVFHFFGVGLAQVRVVSVTCFVLSLGALFLLLRRFQSGITAGLVISLLVVSPYNFAFMRLGILEPPLILFSLLLLLACTHAHWRRWPLLVLCGVLLAVVLFTKTTGIVVLPAAVYLLWRANHREIGLFARCLLVAGGVAAVLAGVYLGLVCRSHHALDFAYLFKANQQPNFTLHSRFDAMWGAIWDGHWTSNVLYPAAWAVLLLSIAWLRRMARNPLFGACVLWIGSTLFFIGWHCNLQPRYYMSVLPPVAVLVCMQLEYAWKSRKRLLTAALILVVASAFLHDLPRTLRWATHPEYTYWNAAHSLAAVIRSDPQPNRLMMGISDSQITLMTGLRTICDDFGTDELDDRILRYKPGWYSSWDEIDPGTLISLVRFYQLQKVASWPAMDDPERRVLILWRLVPRAVPGPPEP